MKNKFIPIFFRFCFLLMLGLWVSNGAEAQIITTIAGTGTAGYSGDSGAATGAELSFPEGVAVDGSGNVYIADNLNGRVRKISTSGTMSTLAGCSSGSYPGDGGPATAAELLKPTGVAVDGTGNVYIADWSANRIRKVTASGIISTIAGTGTAGYSGDGGPATSAELNHPSCVAVDSSGNVYFGDEWNFRIRKITPSGTISTYAGDGHYDHYGDGGPATVAAISTAIGVAVDASGNLYIADFQNQRIRKVTSSGIISTIAGTGWYGGYSGDGGPATAAELYNPTDVAVDSSGNIYIADKDNNRIRKVTPSGIISTIAGNGTAGYSGDGGMATAAELFNPWGIGTDGSGNVYIADGENHSIRKINSCLPAVSAITGSTLLCAGSATTLIDTTAGGSWSSGTPSVATVSSSGIVTGVSAGTVIISYSVTNSCGTAVDTMMVTVNPLPNAGSITGASSVCVGSTIALADAASGGTWSSGTTSVATVSSGGIVTGVSAGTTIISYTVTNSCGTAVATRSITVNPLPNAGTITGATVVCAGSAITLTDAASGGTWSSDTPSVATVSSSGIVTGVSAGTTVITYSVTNSCGTAVDTMMVTVNPLPNSGTISGTTSVCAGASAITLTATVTGGAWSSSSTSLATVSSSGVVTIITAGVVTISYSVTNSCGTAVSTHNITITGPPAVSSITGASVLCIGDSTVLTDITTGGTWSSGMPSRATVNSHGTVTAVSAGTVTISYAVTGSCGTTTATRTLTVSTTPTVLPISGPASLCIGGIISLTDSTSGGVWSSASTTIATVNSWGVVTGVSAGTDSIRYTVTNACGSISALYILIISAAPSTAIISGASAICMADSTTFTASLPGGSWTSSSAAVATVNSLGEVYSVAAGAATISYTISNICGTSRATKSININPLPNASAISGTDSLCSGLTTILADTSTGGTWVSTNTSIATVNSTGTVTSVAPGATNILYIVTNFCGADTAVFPFLVKDLVDCPDGITGIEQQAGSTLTVYPNPNDGNFTIHLSSSFSEEVQFIITNVLGEKVKEITGVTNKELNVQLHVPSGIYFMTVVTNNERLVSKIVVE